MHDQQLILATGIFYHNTDTYTAATTDAVNYRHNWIGRNIDEELAGSSTREIAAASQKLTAIIPTSGVSSRNVALLCLLFFLSVIYRQVEAKYSTKTIGVVLSPYLSDKRLMVVRNAIYFPILNKMIHLSRWFSLYSSTL